MSQELPETIYSPESQMINLPRLVRNIFADLSSCRFLAWRLFVRNLSAQYRQTALGYIWLFLPPIAITLTWVFLNAHNVLNAGATELPYPVFVFPRMPPGAYLPVPISRTFSCMRSKGCRFRKHADAQS